MEHWLAYWSLIGMFMVIQPVIDFFLSWFPFYFLFKIVIVYWLQQPKAAASISVFQTWIVPFIHNHEESIYQFSKQSRDLFISGSTAVFYTIMSTFSSQLQFLVSTLLTTITSTPNTFKQMKYVAETLHARRLFRQGSLNPPNPEESVDIDQYPEFEIRRSRRFSRRLDFSDIDIEPIQVNEEVDDEPDSPRRAPKPPSVFKPRKNNLLAKATTRKTQWRRYVDKQTGYYYYYNKRSKERTWEEPDSWIPGKTKKKRL